MAQNDKHDRDAKHAPQRHDQQQGGKQGMSHESQQQDREGNRQTDAKPGSQSQGSRDRDRH